MANALLLILAALAGAGLMRRLTAAAEVDRDDEPRSDLPSGDPTSE